jgi:hypothetical protein
MNDTPIPSGRDVRVDRIGYVQELVRQYADKLKKQVKERMDRDSLLLLEGDAFEGRLAASTSSTIDAEKFLRLWERGTITRKDFLAAITVQRSQAAKLMSPFELEAISETEDGAPRLTIVRKKGVEVSLIQALSHVQAAAGEC